MKIHRKYFVAIFISTILMTGCQQESSPVPTIEEAPPKDEFLTNSELSSMIQDFALIVSESINDQEFRQTLKTEAQLMFDADYDVLCNTFQEKYLPKSKSFVKEHLVSSYHTRINSARISSISGEDFLSELFEIIPNLQISIPIHCDDWDTEKYTPLVVFLPADFDDSKYNDSIPAYDITTEISHI